MRSKPSPNSGPCRRRTLTGAAGLSLLVLPALGLARVAAAPPASPQEAYAQGTQPLFKQFCYNCHSAGKASAGVDLAGYADVVSIQKDQTTWRKVVTQLRERSMPPKGVPQPSAEQRQQLIDWTTHTLDNVDEGLLPKNPGRVLIHRLSRLEYNNTVRDLFGVDSKPADKFPADGGGGGGFDNNADTLFVPPILMERYLGAAGEVLDEASPKVLFFVKPSKKQPPRAVARQILAHFALRAYRRPTTPDEVNRLTALYDAAVKRGESHENAVKFAMKAVLVSPSFLFRVEKDQPTPDAYALGDYELASRLSYFLWSSMPDEQLLQAASAKKLHDPKVLEAQVRRMLADPKSQALAESFGGQWLRIRELFTTAQPDPRRFPEFTPAVRDAMYGETVEFIGSILKEDRSLLELLDANYTYVNEDLARLYGIPGVTGSELRKVTLPDGKRGGILTMGSVLTVTSYPARTSPVLRGKWVLEEVLGAQVPPPPPNAGGLAGDDRPKQGLSFRQRLEQHRVKPECATCHSRMDPIGFGLENFDGIGRWRNDVGGQAVDASGVLATGEKFSGPTELKKLMLDRKEEFLRNLTEKMLSYALGRGLEPYDIPTVRKITAEVARDGYRSSALIREIVNSYPFQYRKNGA